MILVPTLDIVFIIVSIYPGPYVYFGDEPVPEIYV
jgi:hypothetical protein